MSRCTAIHEPTGWRCNRRSAHDGDHLSINPDVPAPLWAVGILYGWVRLIWRRLRPEVCEP